MSVWSTESRSSFQRNQEKKNNLDVNQLTFEPSLIKVCRVALEKFCGLQIENLWNLAPYKGSAMEELREK